MNSHMIVYIDSSALARRAAAGTESELVNDLCNAADRLVSSELSQSELEDALTAPQEVLGDLEIVPTDRRIAAAAEKLAERYGLDAGASVHLAAALSIDAPRVVVATWDRALALAAADRGLAVVPREPALVAA